VRQLTAPTLPPWRCGNCGFTCPGWHGGERFALCTRCEREERAANKVNVAFGLEDADESAEDKATRAKLAPPSRRPITSVSTWNGNGRPANCCQANRFAQASASH
jgi:hypothetical protein